MTDLAGQTPLSGKAWLITGASAGFGRTIAQEILRRGGNVVATARDPSNVADIVAEAPDRALAAALDVTNAEQIDTAVAAALARFGRIDGLVNSAGYGLIGAVEEVSDAEARAQFDVNVFGVAAITRAVLPVMRAQGSGFIVNLSSTAGTRGSPGLAFYAASKFALEAMSESLSRETAELGIRLLIVEPGPFRTDFSGRSIAKAALSIPAYTAATQMRGFSDALDGKQPGDPERAARIILDTIASADPPLRLILGGDAYKGAIQSMRDRLIDMERSRDIAFRADFPT